jgi:hypothetical protein
MKKAFLVIFLFFALYNLSFADNWEPILKIGPILVKDLNLLLTRSSELNKQSEIHSAKMKQISKLLSSATSISEFIKLIREGNELNIEGQKLIFESVALYDLSLQLMRVAEGVSVIETLLSYNPNLTGSEAIKNDFESTIKQIFTSIENDLEIGKKANLSYETIEALYNVKSDLEKILEILQ